MLERKFRPEPGYRRGSVARRRNWGSPVLTVLAGVALLCAGTTAAALAAASYVADGGPAEQCESITAPSITPPQSSAPAPTPTADPAPSTTPTSAPSTEACVSVQATPGTAAPGQAASFGIQVSPVGALDQVTVQIAVTTPGSPDFPAPTFTSCGDGDGTQTCTVGALQAGQASDMTAQVLVPASAANGDTAALSATVTWSVLGVVGTGSVTGSATVEVAAPPATSPTSPTSPASAHPNPSATGGRPRPQGSATSGLGDMPVPHLPPLLSRAGAERTVNPGGLFPTIYPAPVSPGAAGTTLAHAKPARYHATTAADVLPLSARQVGAQIAGLIVLAAAVAAALVRVQLRRPGGPPDQP
jgi:hypothetical protein